MRRFVTGEGFGDAGLRLGLKKYYVAAWFLWPVLGMAALGLTLLLGYAQAPTIAGLAEYRINRVGFEKKVYNITKGHYLARMDTEP